MTKHLKAGNMVENKMSGFKQMISYTLDCDLSKI